MGKSNSMLAGVVIDAIECGKLDGVILRNNLLRWMPEDQLMEFLRVQEIEELVNDHALS
jgi:hypothetical protein